jgi:Spy/CpxP family protein refolding chaperone
MKKVLGLVLMGALLFGASMSYAGGACCAAKGDKTQAKASKDAYCSDVLSKLNLTDDQKKKIADLKAECDKGGCSADGQAKYMKGLKEILTAEQIEQCKAECEKAHKTACPFTKSDSKI